MRPWIIALKELKGSFTSARAIPLWGAMVGMLFAFHSTLFSGLDQIPTDPGDSRFNHFILEHGYQNLVGQASFWSPSIFYPTPGTLAYSDVLVSFAPPYWIARLIGFSAGTSFLFWLFFHVFMNYIGAYFFSRWVFQKLFFDPLARLPNWDSTTRFPSTIAAFLFAFASSRIAQLNHPQLIPQLYVLLSVFGLVFSYSQFQSRPLASKLAIFICPLALALQFYGAFYTAWFFSLAVLIGGLLLLGHPAWFSRSIHFLKTCGMALLLGLGLSALVLWPLAERYLEVAQSHGLRSFTSVQYTVPALQSWLYMGPDNWIYGAWHGLIKLFRMIPVEHEQRIGIGWVSFFMGTAGLFSLARAKPSLRPFAGLSLILFVLLTQLPGGWNLWALVFDGVPGGAAIRVVSRFGLFVLFPLGLGIGYWSYKNFSASKPGKWKLALLILMALEQGLTTSTYSQSKIDTHLGQIASRVQDQKCEVFYYSPVWGDPLPAQTQKWEHQAWKHQIDAMWTSLITGVPTVNGYSGHHAPQWGGLFDNRIFPGADDSRLKEQINQWLEKNPMIQNNFCWLRVPI